MRRNYLLLILLALLAATIACTEFTVINQAARPVSLQITLPDGSSNLVLLGSNGVYSRLVMEGGPYEVSTLPHEAYLDYVRDVQDSTVHAMLTGEVDALYDRFIGAETNPLSAFQAYLAIEEVIEGELQGVTCTGELPYLDLETAEFDLITGDVSKEVVIFELPDNVSWTCTN